VTAISTQALKRTVYLHIVESEISCQIRNSVEAEARVGTGAASKYLRSRSRYKKTGAKATKKYRLPSWDLIIF